MLDQFGQRNLCLQHVLLRHLADRVFDPRRLEPLPRDCNLLIVHSQFIVSAQKVVERFSHLGGNFALLGFKFRFSDADGISGHLRPQRPLARTGEALADHEHVHGGVVIPGLRHRYLPAAIHDRRIIKHASSRYVCLCHRHLSRADANLGIGLQRDLLGLLQADRCHSRIWMRVLRQHIERSLVWIVSRDSQRSSQPEK